MSGGGEDGGEGGDDSTADSYDTRGDAPRERKQRGMGRLR